MAAASVRDVEVNGMATNGGAVEPGKQWYEPELYVEAVRARSFLARYRAVR